MAFYAGQKLKASNLGQLSTTAQYQATVDQTIANNGQVFVAFGQANITSSLVTRGTSGAGHTFTVNASGLWWLSTTVRFAALATNSREAWMEGPVGRICSSSQAGSSGSPSTIQLSALIWADSGSAFAVGVFQNSGGSATLSFDTTNALGRIDIAYILGEG